MSDAAAILTRAAAILTTLAASTPRVNEPMR